MLRGRGVWHCSDDGACAQDIRVATGGPNNTTTMAGKTATARLSEMMIEN